MKYYFVILLLFIVSSGLVQAQRPKSKTDSFPSNNIYLNLLGDASLVSINYEKKFYVRPNYFLTAKIGVGYNEEFDICIWGECERPESYLTIPAHISVNVGKGRHFFEGGIGGTIIRGVEANDFILYTILGYRLYPLRKNKISFRIYGEIPYSGILTESILFIPVGVSLGLSF
ncbi:MAG: hypothetical protein ACK5BV_06420 [Bacteroidota bacterium]